jgi:hypothetical protein
MPMMNFSSSNIPPPALDHSFAFAAGLIEILSSPKGAAKTLSEIKLAVAEHRAAADKVAADRADFDRHQKKERADFDAMVADKTRALDEREIAHRAAVDAFHGEQTAERQKIAAMAAQAEKDRAAAADLMERAQRKIRAFEAS